MLVGLFLKDTFIGGKSSGECEVCAIRQEVNAGKQIASALDERNSGGSPPCRPDQDDVGQAMQPPQCSLPHSTDQTKAFHQSNELLPVYDPLWSIKPRSASRLAISAFSCMVVSSIQRLATASLGSSASEMLSFSAPHGHSEQNLQWATGRILVFQAMAAGNTILI